MNPTFPASTASFVKATPWFPLLPFDAQQRLLSQVHETTHERGETVARAGDPVQAWCGVTDGLVMVRALQADGKVIAFTGVPAGSWFGEGSVIRRDPRRYEVVVMRPTRVVHVPAAMVQWLLHTSLVFNHHIIEHLNERLAQNMALVTVHRQSSPEARLAGTIATLLNPVLYPSFGPVLPFSQEEFSELAGLSRQRTNAAVKVLEKAGVLKSIYGGLQVDDRAGLAGFMQAVVA